MTVFPVTNYKRMINGYDLNITARHMDTLETKYYTELIVRTVKLWLYIAKQIEAGNRKLPDEIAFKSVESSVEELISKDDPLTSYEFKKWDETRVTVFDWNHKLDLTIHSSSLPQSALDIWWAMTDAEKELDKLYPKDTQQPAPQAPQKPITPEQAMFDNLPSDKPATPKNAPQAIEGAIVATRAPNSNRVDYADGQMVLFNINKIETGANKGSTIFKMWSALGTQYPTVTVYMKKPNGELKPDYQIIKPIVDTLGFSLEKTEATGNWQLMCKAATAGDKQYLNVVSLTAT
jgi:hypothetical protein